MMEDSLHVGFLCWDIQEKLILHKRQTCIGESEQKNKKELRLYDRLHFIITTTAEMF